MEEHCSAELPLIGRPVVIGKRRKLTTFSSRLLDRVSYQQHVETA
jgi:hypothetical protein